MSQETEFDILDVIFEEVERLRSLKKYDEALDILKVLVDPQSSEFYDDEMIKSMIESQMASITTERAIMLTRQGKYHMSNMAHEEASTYSKEFVNEEQQIIMTSTAALNLLEQGQFEQSAKMFKGIVRDSIRVHGTNHECTIIAQANFARALDKQMKYNESLALYKEVMKKAKNLKPDEQIIFWVARLNMAVVLLKMGRPEEALIHFEAVYYYRLRTCGPDHLETLTAYNNLAKALLAIGDRSGAFSIFSHVFEKRKAILGKFHPYTLISHCSMGLVHHHNGKHLEALRIYNQVVEQQKATIGDKHPDTKVTMLQIEQLRASVGHRRFAELQEQCAHDAFLELHNLIHLGDKRAVKDLLERSVDITKKTAEKGNTTLHIAVNRNNTEMVEILLKHAEEHLDSEKFNEYINAKTTSKVGNTALHIAACNGCLGPMRVLLRFGATYNIRNKKGETPHEQTKHDSAKDLLDSICKMFDDAKQNAKTIVDRLANLAKEERLVLMGAEDESGQTLGQIIAACRDRGTLKKFAKLQLIE